MKLLFRNCLHRFVQCYNLNLNEMLMEDWSIYFLPSNVWGYNGIREGEVFCWALLATAAILAGMEEMWLPFSLKSQEVWQWDVCLLQFLASWLVYAASAELAALESSDLSFCWDVISNKGKGSFFSCCDGVYSDGFWGISSCSCESEGFKRNCAAIGGDH